MAEPKAVHPVSLRVPIEVYRAMHAESEETGIPVYRMILRLLTKTYTPKPQPTQEAPNYRIHNPFAGE